jgi:hypothetical protein
VTAIRRAAHAAIRCEAFFASEPAKVWHVINSGDLLAMLRRVASGEDPEFVYLEEYVNADREEIESND